MADQQIKMRQANRAFECNRARFYRSVNNGNKTISNKINLADTEIFWPCLWQRQPKDESHQMLIDSLSPCYVAINQEEERIKEVIERVLKCTPNWKAAGPDCVYMFTIKNITALSKKLTQLVVKAIKDPNTINESLYNGVTYLLPKADKAGSPKQLRPITCLPTMYKLIFKTMTHFVRTIVEINEVLAPKSVRYVTKLSRC